jgi:hypothetical protein
MPPYYDLVIQNFAILAIMHPHPRQNITLYGLIGGCEALLDAPHRFTFNGKECTDEIAGAGNHTTALFWEYDTRLGRRWNVDPKPNVSFSAFACFQNNPILYSDILGDTVFINLFNPKEDKDKLFYKVAEEHVKRSVNDGVYVIMAHGDNTVIEYTDESNEITSTNDPEKIFKILCKNPDFRKAFKNKENIELILLSCNTGSIEYTTDGGRLVYQPTPIGQDIAREYPVEIDVYAPEGYVIYNQKTNETYDGYGTTWTKYSQSGGKVEKVKSVTDNMYKRRDSSKQKTENKANNGKKQNTSPVKNKPAK